MNSKGQLTEIGSMYLGQGDTGVVPDGKGRSSSSASSSAADITRAPLVAAVAGLFACMYLVFL
jgi:hypothetical protein